ncbi:MAG TPA: hemerythrin domain-containing protein [Acidimicrobiales bacterium]|jgi:hypothetical protein
MTEAPSARPDTSDMHAVHQVFRSSLASAPQFIGSAERDDGRRALIANYYANLMAFLEVHHEGEEALVFPLLMDRAPDRREIVERAAGQHTEIVGLIDGAKEGVGSWEAEGDARAPGVERSLQDLNTALCAHLDQEEEEILPLAGEHLTAEEWGKLPGHSLGGFEGDKVWLIMGLVREHFTPEQRDAMMNGMPPPVRQMWETTGEASFNHLIAQVRQAG